MREHKRDTRSDTTVHVHVPVCELTSSASSPGRGCGSVGPPGEVWCPAVQTSGAGFSSSAAGRFAGTPRYRPAGR